MTRPWTHSNHDQLDVAVTLRAATLGDADSLAECWVEFARYYVDQAPDRFRVPAEEGLSEWLASQISAVEAEDDALWLVAERLGSVVGYVRAEISRPAPDAHRQMMREVQDSLLWVHGLFVKGPLRRSGVGTILMDAAADWAKSRGATQGVVISFAGDTPALRFYETRMGYERNTIGFWRQL